MFNGKYGNIVSVKCRQKHKTINQWSVKSQSQKTEKCEKIENGKDEKQLNYKLEHV